VPTLADLYQTFFLTFLANPQLKPETVNTYDAGFALGDPAGTLLSVTGFYSRIRDRITGVDLDGDGFNDTNANLPRAEMSGAEVELGTTWGPVRNRANYAYTRAIGSSATSSQNVPLSFTPRNNVNVTTTVEAPRQIRLINTLRYTSKTFEKDGEKGLKIPSFFVWDVGFVKKVLAADLSFSVRNILDKHYADTSTFGALNPQPGRTYWGGVTIRFVD
jgi:outer membrane receptor protein involved in Fe transport